LMTLKKVEKASKLRAHKKRRDVILPSGYSASVDNDKDLCVFVLE